MGTSRRAAPPLPAYGRGTLAELLPSLAAALGLPGFPDHLGLGSSARSAAVLLVDGLGADLLDAHRREAPALSALGRRDLDAGFPSSTATSLTSLGTGLPPGAHGVVGYTFAVAGGILNTITWKIDGADAHTTLPPETLQPQPTVFDRVAGAGGRPVATTATAFAGRGLTRLALRGARFAGVVGDGDLVAAMTRELREPGTLCYGYLSQLDTVGHVRGPDTDSWRAQLRLVDAVVDELVGRLPPGALLAVTGDHGMIATDPASRDVADCPELLDGVRIVAGEPRARYVHARPGAAADVLAAWSELLGADFWVRPAEQVLADGWLGPAVSAAARERLGDVVAAAAARLAVLHRLGEPAESALLGHHGSLTDGERRVPLLLAGPD